MNTLPEPISGQVLLLVAPQAARPAMLMLTAKMSNRGPLRVLDGGNQFNAYLVAREARRDPARPANTLDGITLARAFTCFQMEALLAAQARTQMPLIVLDMLATFYDENVPFAEREWLLGRCLAHLARLRTCVPVAISARPPRAAQPEELRLLSTLEDSADRIWHLETAAALDLQPVLF